MLAMVASACSCSCSSGGDVGVAGEARGSGQGADPPSWNGGDMHTLRSVICVSCVLRELYACQVRLPCLLSLLADVSPLHEGPHGYG